jgi:hypothetical protein
MGTVELVASWTLAGGALPHTDREYRTFEFRERVEWAARVGFKGIGMWHSDLLHILDANGMRHVEIEFLADWLITGETACD